MHYLGQVSFHRTGLRHFVIRKPNVFNVSLRLRASDPPVVSDMSPFGTNAKGALRQTSNFRSHRWTCRALWCRPIPEGSMLSGCFCLAKNIYLLQNAATIDGNVYCFPPQPQSLRSKLYPRPLCTKWLVLGRVSSWSKLVGWFALTGSAPDGAKCWYRSDSVTRLARWWELSFPEMLLYDTLAKMQNSGVCLRWPHSISRYPLPSVPSRFESIVTL